MSEVRSSGAPKSGLVRSKTLLWRKPRAKAAASAAADADGDAGKRLSVSLNDIDAQALRLRDELCASERFRAQRKKSDASAAKRYTLDSWFAKPASRRRDDAHEAGAPLRRRKCGDQCAIMLVSGVFAWLTRIRAACDAYDELAPPADRGRACARCEVALRRAPLRRRLQRVRKARSAGDAWGVDFQLTPTPTTTTTTANDDGDEANVCRLLRDEFAFLSDVEDDIVADEVEVEEDVVRMRIQHARENVVSVAFDDEATQLLDVDLVAAPQVAVAEVEVAVAPPGDVVMWLRRLLGQCEWECGEELAAGALGSEVPAPAAPSSDDEAPSVCRYDFSGVRKYRIDKQWFKLARHEALTVDGRGRLVVVDGGGGERRVLADAMSACALETRGARDAVVTLPDRRRIHLIGGEGGGGSGGGGAEGVRQRLMALFRRRPPLADLRQLGIYQHEGVFGNTLTQLARGGRGEGVPPLVRKCVELVERPPNMDAEGLYRSSASLVTLQQLRFAINARWRCGGGGGGDDDLRMLERYAHAPDVPSGLLKLFVRELREPLIGVDDFQRLLRLVADEEEGVEAEEEVGAEEGATTAGEDDARHQAAIAIVRQMAPPHRDTLELLLAHLNRVVRRACANGMTLPAMAICWGQTLCAFPDAATPDGKMLAARHKNRVTALLLAAYRPCDRVTDVFGK